MKFLYVATKDLKIIMKDRDAFVTLFLMPLMFIVVMSLALGPSFRGPSDNAIKLSVVDEDNSAKSQQVVDALKNLKGISIETQTTGQSNVRALTRTDAASLLKEGRRVAALVIPAGFGAAVATGEQAHAIVLQDPAQANMGNVIVGAVTGILAQTLGDELAQRGAESFFKPLQSVVSQLPPQAQTQFDLKKIQADALAALKNPAPDAFVRVETELVASRRVETPGVFEQNVPGFSVMFVFFIVNYVASSILTEKRDGTFRRLMVAPISKPALLAGKLVPNFLVSLMQLAVMFSVGHFVFGMKIGNDLFALVLVSVAVAAAATGLGILVATLAKTEQQVSGYATLVILTMAALGGTMVPLFVMPEFMQNLARITPHAWALIAYQNVIVRGMTTLDILPQLAALFGFAAAFYSIALWRFRFD